MPELVINVENVRTIGKKLREMRTAKDISQEEVGKKMKRKQSYISLIESGKKVPSMPTIVSYLKAIKGKLRISA